MKVSQSSTKAVFLGCLLSCCRIGLTSRHSGPATVVDDEDEAEYGGVLLTDDERCALQFLPLFSDVKTAGQRPVEP